MRPLGQRRGGRKSLVNRSGDRELKVERRRRGGTARKVVSVGEEDRYGGGPYGGKRGSKTNL